MGDEVWLDYHPACLDNKVLHESICAYGDTDADETFRAEGCERDVERSECGAGVLSYLASHHTQPAGWCPWEGWVSWACWGKFRHPTWDQTSPEAPRSTWRWCIHRHHTQQASGRAGTLQAYSWIRCVPAWQIRGAKLPKLSGGVDEHDKHVISLIQYYMCNKRLNTN